MQAGRELDALIHKRVMGFTAGDVPKYSTDIQSAWQVVEKLCKRGFISFYVGSRKRWACDIDALEGNVHSFIQSDDCDTAPLAICLAALKAVGYEAPQGSP